VSGVGEVTVRAPLGNGSFGSVYLVDAPGGHQRAMKVEAAGAPGTFSQVEYEHRVYGILDGMVGVPRVYGYDDDGTRRYLVMDLLGKNLQDVLKNAPGERLPLRYVCIIGIRTLVRLRDMHRQGLLHRDVKPQNFLLGSGGDKGTSDIWAVDFGLAKPYRSAGGAHMPYVRGKNGLTGTPRFASTFAQSGEENSRRDDLESLLYMLAYLFRGDLPWQNIRLPRGTDPKSPEGRRQKNRTILDHKLRCDHGRLYGGMGDLAECAAYVRGLGFDEEPDYDRIRSVLRRAYQGCTEPTKNNGP
jgi:casein kinase 1